MKRTVAIAFVVVSMIAAAQVLAKTPKKSSKAPRTVEVAVTSAGFEPAEIPAHVGETLRLVITRKTDRTCATEIVIKELGVKQALPLDQAISVEVTPKKAGHIRYSCAMDMIAGNIVVK